jgi:protease I
MPREDEMAGGELSGLRVAILATDGFEQSELFEPREALEQAGASTSVVSPKHDRVRGWKSGDWGAEAPVDAPLADARPEEFDALLLPGGVMNPDRLRMDKHAVAFTQSFMDAGKPIAAICHGPWTLIETGRMRGRRMTSWPSLRTDAQNAGAEWVDEETIVDGNILTSRKPADIPAFNREMVALFGQRRKRAA